MSAPLTTTVYAVVRANDGVEEIDLQSIAHTRQAAEEDRQRHERRLSHAYRDRNKFVRIGRFRIVEER